jgi:hypothetical protein
VRSFTSASTPFDPMFLDSHYDAYWASDDLEAGIL